MDFQHVDVTAGRQCADRKSVERSVSSVARLCQSHPHRKVWMPILGLILLGLGAASYWTIVRLHDPARASKPFRIGFQLSPPFQMLAADGSPTGPAIEIVAEASRRRGIPVQWVYAPEGPEPNLGSGKVDLWPLLGDVQDRRKFIHFSQPWIITSWWLVALNSSGISTPEQTAGRTVMHTSVAIARRLARANFPK